MAGRIIKASSVVLVGAIHREPRPNAKPAAAREVVADHFGNEQSVATVTVPLYCREHRIGQTRIYNSWYGGHRLRTSTFGLHGWGSIAKKALPAWDEHFREYSVLWEDGADRLTDILDTVIIPAAKNRLRKLGEEPDVVWPTQDEFRKGFVFEKTVRPFPSQWVKLEDVRQDLNDGAVEVFTRFRDALGKSASVLSAYGQKKHARLETGPTQGNLSDLVDAIAGLNIPDEHGNLDPRLTELETEITSGILAPSLEDLKSDGGLRKQTATKAQALRDKVAGYV